MQQKPQHCQVLLTSENAMVSTLVCRYVCMSSSSSLTQHLIVPQITLLCIDLIAENDFNALLQRQSSS